MATKTRHDLLLEKIRRRYEGDTTQQKSGIEKKDLNWWEQLGAGYQQFRDTALTNFLDLGEGVIDSFALVGADWAGAFNKQTKDDIVNWVKDDFISDIPQQQAYQDAMNILGLDFMFGENAKQVAMQKEALPEIIDNIASGVGSAVGFSLLNAVPFAGTALAWAGASGASAEEALRQGATPEEAMLYGLASGGVEMATEKFVGKGLSKIGLGSGKFAGLGKGTSTSVSKNVVSKVLSKIGKNFFEEGTEEAVTYVLDPIIQKMTYKQDQSLDEIAQENGGWEGLAETFLLGGLTGGVMEGANISLGITKHGAKDWDIKTDIESIAMTNEEIKEAYKKGDEAEIQRLITKREKIENDIANKYGEYLQEIESNRIANDEIIKRGENGELTKKDLKQIKRQGFIDEIEHQKTRDLRKEVANEISSVVTGKKQSGEANVNVVIGEFQRKADGSVERLQGSYYDERMKRIVLKSSQVKYNKLAEVLGHEFKHVLESKELTELLLEELSDADYKRLYKQTYDEYSSLEGFNKYTAEEQRQYINEEITADILAGYFSNLNQMERAFKKMDAKGIKRLYYNIKQLFDESPRKFKNYKKVMELLEKTRSELITKQQSENTTETTESKPRYKLDGTQSETITEEQAQGIDEYGSKRLIEEPAESARYSVDTKPTTVPINEEMDVQKGYKLTLENDEYKVKGLEWYESLEDKLDEIETKYSDEEISETVYERRIDALNEKIEDEISNLENALSALEDYDLDSMDDYEIVPKPKQIERLVNYAYNIQMLVNDSFPNVSCDFSQWLDEDSKVNELYDYLVNGRETTNVETATTEEVSQETVEEQPVIETAVETTTEPEIIEEQIETVEEKVEEPKREKTEKAKEVEDVFLQVISTHTEIDQNEIVSDMSELFDEEQIPQVKEDLDYMVNGWITNGERYYGLDFFYRNLNRKQTSAKSMCVAVENVLGKIENIYRTIEENAPTWMKDGELGKLEKALKFVGDLSEITTKIYDSIDESFDNRSSVDDEFNFETISISLESFGDLGSTYDNLVKELESKIQAVKNGQIRKKSVNVNRGAEAKTYGNEGRTYDIPTKTTSVQSNIEETKRIEPTETQSNEVNTQQQDGQELPTSSTGTIEETRDDSSGVHTDSETVVESTETQPETNEVEAEEVKNDETITNTLNVPKTVYTQIRTVIIQNTRKVSPKNNNTTIRRGAELYNKKVYIESKDVKPLRERVVDYMHHYHGQSIIFDGKGYEMVDSEVFAIMNTIDKNMSIEQRVDKIYDVYAKYFNDNIPKKKAKTIKNSVKKIIREQMETGGRKSIRTKLIESTAEYARKKYAEELDVTYKNLEKALNMVDVYKTTIDTLKGEIKAIKETSEADNKDNLKKIKELSKEVKKLEKSVEKLTGKNEKQHAEIEKLKAELKNTKNQIASKEIEIKKLQKKLKNVATAKATAVSQYTGKKVINKDFRQMLDNMDFTTLEKDGIKATVKQVDDSLYNKIAFHLSEHHIADAVKLYLEHVGDTDIEINGTKYKMNDGSQEWFDFGAQINDLFTEYYSLAEDTVRQQLEDEVKLQEEITKGISTLLSTSYTVKKKLNKKAGVALPLNNVAKNLVSKIAKPSITSLKKGTYREAIADLYKELTKQKDGLSLIERLSTEFDPQILADMNEIGNNSTGDMTVEEIQKMNKILRYFSSYLTRSSGGTVYEGADTKYKGKTYREIAVESISKQKSLGQRRRFLKTLYSVNPRVVMEYLDGFQSGANTFIYQELERAETVEQTTYLQLYKIMDDFRKSPEGKRMKKLINKKVSFEYEGKNGIHTFEATVGQMLSLYKLLKRSDSRTHLQNSGFAIRVKKMLGAELKEVKFTPESIKSFEIALINKLQLNDPNSVYSKYIEVSTKFFEAGKKLKMETDLDTKGYTNIITGEEYFPIKCVAYDMLVNMGQSGFNPNSLQGARDFSFNSSVEGLRGTLEVSSIDQVIHVYMGQMSKYVAYAKPVDMINTIFNYQVQESDLKEGLYKGETLRSVMTKQYGSSKGNQSNVIDYYDKLLKDIQGIRTSRDSIFEKLRKKYATYQLGANLKVVATQLSAFPTALRYISPWNLAKAMFTKETENLPVIGQYRVIDKTLISAQTLNDQITETAEFFGKGMQFTDNLVIKTIWKACLLQCNNNVTTATELFEKTIRETQGFNTLQRSALLRSDNSIIKSMMMFTMQPSHNWSNLVEIALHNVDNSKSNKKMSKEDIRKYTGSVAGILMEGAIYTAISMLFKHLLDKDDEEDYEFLSILESFFNDTILGMIPFLNQIEVDFQGEKITEIIKLNDFNLGSLSQMNDAIQNVLNVFDTEVSPEKKFRDLFYAVGMFTGIPTRNLTNYGMMFYKWIAPQDAYDLDIRLNGYSLYNKEAINDAIEKGNDDKAWAYYKSYTNKIVTLDDEVTEEMFGLYYDGYKDSYLKQIPSTAETAGGKEITIDRTKFANTYSKVSKPLKLLINSTNYKVLSDDEKASLIKKLVAYYYNIAMSEQTGKELNNIEILIANGDNITKTMIYLNEISQMEATARMTKKEVVAKYIKRLQIPLAEKYLLYLLAGYKIPDKNKSMVKNLLRRKGLDDKTIKLMIDN